MKKALAIALFAAVAAAAGCASSERRAARQANPAPCPNVVVLADAGRVIEFDGEPALENVAYSGEIVNVHLDCRYFLARPIEASLRIELAFGKGPKAAQDTHQYKYFVAVTRTNMEVIEKVEIPVSVRFGSNESVRTVRERIEQITIPRADENTSGTNFEVIVGLVLTPQQAIYNRSSHSLKFPEL